MKAWRPSGALALYLALILAAVGFQLFGGAYPMSAAEVMEALLGAQTWRNPEALAHLVLGQGMAQRLVGEASAELPASTLVLWGVRLPRVLAGALVGINLSLSGLIFQAITRNELASPYTLGVGAGSGLAIWLTLVAFPVLGAHLPLVASLGGALAFLITYSIAWHRGTSPVRLLLAGVIVAAMAGSVQSSLFFMAHDIQVIQDAAAWTVGTLAGSSWGHVTLALPWTALGLALALASSRHLDLLSLGDVTSRALGMRVEAARFFLACVAILTASTAVAVAGHVAFVGLIIPHIVRSASPQGHRAWLLRCLLAGPALLMSADAVARLALNPVQLPVGTITGLTGGLYFLYLMRRHHRLGRV